MSALSFNRFLSSQVPFQILRSVGFGTLSSLFISLRGMFQFQELSSEPVLQKRIGRLDAIVTLTSVMGNVYSELKFSRLSVH